MRSLPFLLAAALTAGLATAQCPFNTVTVTGYGQGCNPVFLNDPTLQVALDVTNCTLGVTVDAFPGCCNTFLSATALAIGEQPATIPLPFGAGCNLLVQPTFLLFMPGAANTTYDLPLASALPPLTVYVQGAALYFTTIGFTTDVAVTAGAEITLQ